MNSLSSPSGLLFIDKEEGISSRKIDNAMQKMFRTKKVGHLGTLDPFATGLLIVAVNKATKTLAFLDDGEKTYEARLELGTSTTTGDKDGDKNGEKPIPALSQESAEAVFSSFLGDGEQIPPMTSAIKVQGQALYVLAHKGQEIERAPRPVHIDSLRLLELGDTFLRFEAKVSKGTYIRVLGEDIAKALGTLGYLSSLRRTKVGHYDVKDAIPLSKVDFQALKNPLPYLAHLPQAELGEEDYHKAKNGVALSLPKEEKEVLLTHRGEAVAVYAKKERDLYVAFRGLF